MAGSGSSGGDGLVRWLAGGLVAGAIVLGLLVGAYEIGYHRGQDSTRNAAPQPAPPTTTTTTTGGEGPVAHGRRLFTADGCSGCHSLDGSAGAGPTVEGLAGSRVELDDGSTVVADDAYLSESITDPDAQVVKGYQARVMSAAIASFGLDGKPDDVAALVAFMKTRR